MRPTTFLLLLVAMLAIIALSAASAQAQALPLIFFDENGTIGNGPGFPTPPVFAGVTTDPLSTGPPAATVNYILPFPVVTGDVQLTEPPTGISDLVRFENLGPTGGEIFFYSDTATTSDPGEALADVGLPTLLGPNPTVIAEVGPDNNNSAVYIPTPGMPGFPLAGPPAIQYNIISDVPEPTSILLAGLGGASLLLALRRRTS
jgi:hypothetical protein